MPAEKLPFGDASMDFVFSRATFHEFVHEWSRIGPRMRAASRRLPPEHAGL